MVTLSSGMKIFHGDGLKLTTWPLKNIYKNPSDLHLYKQQYKNFALINLDKMGKIFLKLVCL